MNPANPAFRRPSRYPSRCPLRLALLAAGLCALMATSAGAQPAPATATSPAAPYDEAAVTAARTRIAQERTQARTQYAQAEFTCWRRFAVNDCLRKARTDERRVLADLRQQELALNDLERRHRASERLKRIQANEQALRERGGEVQDSPDWSAAEATPEAPLPAASAAQP